MSSEKQALVEHFGIRIPIRKYSLKLNREMDNIRLWMN